jgi:xylan 1,4-beta-xylosidase
VEVDFERLYFAYRLEGENWRRLSGHLDASILSDEAAAPGTPNFTGAFVGVCCQDLAGTRRHADFDYFVYEERGYRANPFREES